jgi:hypothetical protein
MEELSNNVIQIDRVRCLECGAKYVKPADGGTVHENPGCPKCGYSGWISATIPAAANRGLMGNGVRSGMAQPMCANSPVKALGGLRRFAGDLRPRQAVRVH